MNLLRGDISVISESGKGSTFRLSLPVVVNDMGNSAQEGEDDTLQEKENIMRILVVDDNKEMRDYLRQLFSPFLSGVGSLGRKTCYGDCQGWNYRILFYRI